MKLHCLGTAGYHPCESRHTSCYFLPEVNLMLDAGTGLFRAGPLFKNDEISILLSHAHLDHTFGLTFFLDYVAVTPLRKIHVYGEQEKLQAIRTHLFSELLFPVLPPIEWHTLESMGQEFSIAGATCRWFRLEHPGGSVGYRLQWPQLSFAYITDTTATPEASYWHEIQGVDWLLHECNFSDDWVDLAIKTGHSWTTSVLKSAGAADIRRLILTHINPLASDSDPLGLVEANTKLSEFMPKETMVASDSMVIDLLRL